MIEHKLEEIMRGAASDRFDGVANQPEHQDYRELILWLNNRQKPTNMNYLEIAKIEGQLIRIQSLLRGYIARRDVQRKRDTIARMTN